MLDRGLAPKVQELRSLPLIGGFLTEARVRDMRNARSCSILAHKDAILRARSRPASSEASTCRRWSQQKVAAFPVERLESLILEVASRELRAITWLGGVLGALIGRGQVALLWILG